ncbi:MAG: phosphatidate cytidylyltransferase, partial [Bacilli bacterium]|nr:phosphatidate cytidylyltransferase [Bacilli bacterium]
GASFATIGLVVLLLLIPSIFDKKDKYTTKEAFYLIGSTVVLGLFFNLLMLLFNGNKWVLLYLILIATMTDTFAMLIGCLIGKHKLIPDVSPKKSVEGSIAGSLLGTIIASVYYYTIVSSNINLVVLIIMTLVLSILGQLGDLFFSKIKRENDIKDFSNLMPGHGGILDRFDSMTFILYGYIIIINIINLLK